MTDSHYFILVKTNDQLDKLTTSITSSEWGWWGYGTDDNYQLFNLAGLTPCKFVSEQKLEKYSQKIYKYELSFDNDKVKVCVNPFTYPSDNVLINVGNWREALSYFNNWLGSCVVSIPRMKDWTNGLQYTLKNIFVRSVSKYNQQISSKLTTNDISYLSGWLSDQIQHDNDLLLTTFCPLFNVSSSHDELTDMCVLRQLWLTVIDLVVETFDKQYFSLQQWNQVLSPINKYSSCISPVLTTEVASIYISYDIRSNLKSRPQHATDNNLKKQTEQYIYEVWHLLQQSLHLGQLNLPIFIQLINRISCNIRQYLHSKITKFYIPTILVPSEINMLSLTIPQDPHDKHKPLHEVTICWNIIHTHVAERISSSLPIDLSVLNNTLIQLDNVGNKLCRRLSYPINWQLSNLLNDTIDTLNYSSLSLDVKQDSTLPASSVNIEHQYDQIQYVYNLLLWWVEQLVSQKIHNTSKIIDYFTSIGYVIQNSTIFPSGDKKIWGQIKPDLKQISSNTIKLHQLIDRFIISIEEHDIPYFRMDELYDLCNKQITCLGLPMDLYKNPDKDLSISTLCVWHDRVYRDGYNLCLSDDSHYYISLKNPCIAGLSQEQLIDVLEFLDTVADGDIIFDSVRRKITDALAK